jgi:predicted nucleotidyltransferase
MSIGDALQERSRLKAAWLDRITGRLHDDDRVAALWLFGSEARGEADELSDIDVFVAFQDPAATELARVSEWLTEFGELVRAHESAYNAPEAGRFFEAVYTGHPLPVVADTHWLPVSYAVLGSDAKVLIDKVGLPHAEPPRPTFELIPAVRDALPFVPATDPTERLRDAVEWFWSDVCIVAKHQARRWPWADDEITALWAVVYDVAVQLGSRIVGPEHRPAGLRPLLAEMERLAPLLEAPACASGQADANDWVSVSERLVQEDWSPASQQTQG